MVDPKTSTLLLTIAICAFGVAFAASTTSDVTKTGAADTQKVPAAMGTRDRPIVVETIAAKDDFAETQAKAQEREDKTRIDKETLRIARWMLYATIGLLLVAIVQASFFIWQLRLMKQSMVDTAAAALAAIRSADTMRQQLRAYAVVEDVKIKRRDGKPFIYVFIKNYGQTPANNIRYWLHAEPIAGDASAAPPKPASAIFQGKIAVMPPQDGVSTEFDVPTIEAADVTEIEGERKMLCLFGQAVYADVFGKESVTNIFYTRVGKNWLDDGDMYQGDDGNEAT